MHSTASSAAKVSITAHHLVVTYQRRIQARVNLTTTKRELDQNENSIDYSTEKQSIAMNARICLTRAFLIKKLRPKNHKEKK